MAIQLLPSDLPSPLERLADDFLNNGRARGLSPRTDQQYAFSLRSIFLPWCAIEGVTDVSQLDRRMLDRFTSSLLERRTERGAALSKFSVHSYIRPVRIMLTWATR